MSDRHFSASEHQWPCNLSASRGHVDLAFDDRHLHRVVSKHVDQKHLIVSLSGLALHNSPMHAGAHRPYAVKQLRRIVGCDWIATKGRAASQRALMPGEVSAEIIGCKS
jgi:hypothetical protein